MTTRRTTLIVALVLALGTGWLTLSYLSNLQRQTNANTAPIRVIVAGQEIPARVPITEAMLGAVSRPANAVDPNTITDPRQVVGSLSLITIPAGASLTGAMIGHPSDVGLTVRLKPGLRAVSISIDKVKGISGLVQPGDFVDVIAQAPKSGAAPPPAATILRGVRVLSIGDDLESSSATPSPQEQLATTVTLEVTPKQANLLVMADLNTSLRLALRSPKEPLNSQPTEVLHFDQGQSSSGGGGGGIPAAGPSQALADAALLKAITSNDAPPRAPAAARAPAAGAQSGAVTVIDGDHYTGTPQQ
ncbi:MAG: Flp pilus assembly protein CpaB [Candidatus Baltobacteraceae bacterium]